MKVIITVPLKVSRTDDNNAAFPPSLIPDIVAACIDAIRREVQGGYDLGYEHPLSTEISIEPIASEVNGVAEIEASEIERLEELIATREKAITDSAQEAIDNAVHDTASTHASSINNGGITAQLTYLCEQLGVPAVENLIGEIEGKAHGQT